MEKHSDLPGIESLLFEWRRCQKVGSFSKPISNFVSGSGNAEMANEGRKVTGDEGYDKKKKSPYECNIHSLIYLKG